MPKTLDNYYGYLEYYKRQLNEILKNLSQVSTLRKSQKHEQKKVFNSTRKQEIILEDRT